MNTETIYALRKNDAFVYVGRSVAPNVRANQHRRRGVDFDDCVKLATVNKSEAAKTERKAIIAFDPIHNRTLSTEGMHAATHQINLDSLVARCDDSLKRRVQEMERRTGLCESEIIRMAVQSFLTNHNTPESVIQAIQIHRAARQ